MSGFDDFKNARDQKKQDDEMLSKGTEAEWVILKGFASQFALDGENIDGHNFQWLPEPHAEMLILNHSSATFASSGWSIGVMQNLRIIIGRRPPGVNQVYVSDALPSTTWSLEPKVEKGNFSWIVRETNWKGSSSALAAEVAKAVVQYHDEYKKKYPLAV
jgi:hypothetical protein